MAAGGNTQDREGVTTPRSSVVAAAPTAVIQRASGGLPVHLVRAAETLTFRHGGPGRPLWQFELSVGELREALKIVGVGVA